jgi:hypothetical protein
MKSADFLAMSAAIDNRENNAKQKSVWACDWLLLQLFFSILISDY